jgi:SAM-dependent methyltransferase
MKDYIKDTLNYYDNNIDLYKKLWLDDFSSNYNFEIPDVFLSYLDKNSKILDMGCGTGRDSKYFKELGHIVKSIDGSLEMCKIASSLLNEEVQQLNFLDIDYKNEFDGIFACASLLHLSNEDLLIVLKKISNALKENGILYTCFKYGDSTRINKGRFYNDMNEEKFINILNNVEDLKILKTWVTEQYKSDTKFINYIIRKNK